MTDQTSHLDDVLMVATDLDGTLLDHHTYSWAAARPALNILRAKRIPVLINTSKTIAEVTSLQYQLSLEAPFVVENGSAMIFPKRSLVSPPDGVRDFDDSHSIKVFGVARAEIIAHLQHLREEFSWRFEGFSDWDIKQVVEHTGLDLKGAEQALSRQFSEPILWQDSKENFDVFEGSLAALNYKILRGGRFIHILGDSDKGAPLKWLSQYYQQQSIGVIKWIVLGDSRNDIDMLKMADYPVVIKSPVAEYPQFSGKCAAIYTDDYGPEGWNKAITKILEQG